VFAAIRGRLTDGKDESGSFTRALGADVLGASRGPADTHNHQKSMQALPQTVPTPRSPSSTSCMYLQATGSSPGAGEDIFTETVRFPDLRAAKATESGHCQRGGTILTRLTTDGRIAGRSRHDRRQPAPNTAIFALHSQQPQT
jgi:hypothetical protein